MTNKLTLEEKIEKTLEYCEYSKEVAFINCSIVDFQIEIEYSSAGIETDVLREMHQYSAHYATVEKLEHMLNLAIIKAQEGSKIWGNLVSVKVWIKTSNSECELIDEEPIDDYEIKFENGIEVQ